MFCQYAAIDSSLSIHWTNPLYLLTTREAKYAFINLLWAVPIGVDRAVRPEVNQ